jgi:DHA1 family multidrug resistance protein-like MFS transporter
MGGIVAALGGAGFEASGKAALAYLSKGYSRESIFSLSVTCGNAGMALGPLVGVMLIKVDFAIVGLAAAAVYLLCFALIWIYVPEIDTNHGEAQHRITIGEITGKLGNVWSNKPFVVLCVLLVGYYFLYVQINITLPLMAVKLSGSEDSVSLIFALNSGMAIFFQFFSVKLIRKWLQPVTIIGVGITITTLGLAAVTFINDYASLIICVVIYALGRLLVDPVVYTITTRYATDDTMASYFGFSSLALAFGGMFGNSLGGWLYDTGNAIGFPSLCWVVFTVVGGSVAVGMFVFHGWERKQAESFQKSSTVPGGGAVVASPGSGT